ARLARELVGDAVRLERLQGFGAPLGRLRTCACRRFTTADGVTGLLVAAAEPAGRGPGYAERVRLLLDGLEAPAAAFDPTGRLIDANAPARRLTALERDDEFDLALLGRDLVSTVTLGDGHATIAAAVGEIEVFKLGQGGETTLVALIPLPAELELPVEAAEPAVAEPLATRIPATEPPAAELQAPASPATEIAVVAAPLETHPSSWPDSSRPSTSSLSKLPEVVDARDEPGHDESIRAETALVPEPVPAPAGVAAPSEPAAVEPPPAEIEPQPPEAPEAEIAEAIASVVLADHPASPAAPEAPAEAVPAAAEAAVANDSAATETIAPVTADVAPAEIAPPPADESAPHAAAPALLHEPALHDSALTARRHPLRFIWQMDAEGRFVLGSDEFARLIGPRTATAFGRPWREVAEQFGLDPDGRVAAAVATRDTWSGITVSWPVDGPDARLRVELSGLPVYDRAGQFLGYRGFGICRDLDGLDHLATQRRHDALRPEPAPDACPPPPPQHAEAADQPASAGLHSPPPPQATDAPVETPPNVVPFRPATEPKAEPKALAPALTAVENHAFNELARQLASRLEAERSELDRREATRPTVVEEAPAPPAAEADHAMPPATEPPAPGHDDAAPWTMEAHAAPRAESRRDALLYDRIPVGILVYQLDRLLYANRAFLDRVGYPDLQVLAAAGGLDALYVEPGAAGGGSATEEGTPVRIAATGGDGPTDARLHGISWDGEAAHALIFSATLGAGTATPPAAAVPPAPVAAPSADPDAAELRAVVDASDDAILVLDRDGEIIRCNASARRLFAAPDRDSAIGRLADLVDPAGHGVLREQFDALRQAPAATTQAREYLGISRDRRAFPLRLTMGRTDASGTRFFAICRDLSTERAPVEIAQRKQAERAAGARAEILARVSQDLRTPLNAIVGFADVMIEERFGTLGNERYAAYLKDIRASAERMLAVINDMVDLSRAETGQLELSLGRQDLNETVEQCVAVLQPQANRERIIIRTALAQSLPPVTADAAALRQIVLNLVGNSIHVARAGGQIIVSTAVTDLGDIVLRVRDTGRGLNHTEMEAALEQFRNPAGEQVAQDNVGINMSLTRALVEANRAQFHVRSAPHSGTLIEVSFPPLAARAV
ncbi:MAG: PAS domain-containing protein, partial [Xanthobacteraceae bacterium]|nr:PAS domain-containing protein [Xanthobacteraceae bacterium]